MVHYSCALGRKLFKYLPDETIMYDKANYTCQWDRTWWPDTEVGRSINNQSDQFIFGPILYGNSPMTVSGWPVLIRPFLMGTT